MLSRILSSAVVEGKDGEGKGVEDEPKGRVVCGGGAGGRCRGGAANARRRKGEGGEWEDCASEGEGDAGHRQRVNPPRPCASKRVEAVTKFQTLQTLKPPNKPQGEGFPSPYPLPPPFLGYLFVLSEYFGHP